MNKCFRVKKWMFSFRGCRGTTLVEILVALGIGSLAVAWSAQILTQMFVLIPKVEGSMLAMRQVQFAGHWISRDTTMAQLITPTPMTSPIDLSVTPLTISHVNWDATKTTVAYYVDTNKQLQRQVVVTSEQTGSVISSNVTPIADNIESIEALYAKPAGVDRKILAVTITAQVWNSSTTKTFQAWPRPFQVE